MTLSKKQQRKLDKAQWLAKRKTERKATGEWNRQRKRRGQRQAHMTIHATVPETTTIEYVPCASVTCATFSTGTCQLRVVRPYVYRFQTYVKGRWCGRTLFEVFQQEFEGLSSTYCEDAIRLGLIRINQQPQTSSYVLRNGDFVEHVMHRHEPPAHFIHQTSSSTSSAAVTSLIRFETSDIVVVDKPSSIPVHPSGAYRHNSMTFLLQNELNYPELFPVHRLDRLTSGLLLLAKSADKARALSEEIAARNVQKHYVARVVGNFPLTDQDSTAFDALMHQEGHNDDSNARVRLSRVDINGETYWRLDAPIACVDRATHVQGVSIDHPDSKLATTILRRLHVVCDADSVKQSVVECLPVTGRTHQIRVHLQYLGFPIVNDPLYGPKVKIEPIAEDSYLVEVADLEKAAEGDDALLKEGEPDEDGNNIEEEWRRICPACQDGTDAAVLSTIQRECFSLWLHSFKYESSHWSFSVPLPSWAMVKKSQG